MQGEIGICFLNSGRWAMWLETVVTPWIPRSLWPSNYKASLSWPSVFVSVKWNDPIYLWGFNDSIWVGPGRLLDHDRCLVILVLEVVNSCLCPANLHFAHVLVILDFPLMNYLVPCALGGVNPPSKSFMYTWVNQSVVAILGSGIGSLPIRIRAHLDFCWKYQGRTVSPLEPLILEGEHHPHPPRTWPTERTLSWEKGITEFKLLDLTVPIASLLLVFSVMRTNNSELIWVWFLLFTAMRALSSSVPFGLPIHGNKG